MSRDAALSSVNCASCGAGLDIFGGGRVTTHICPYCAAALDATEGYRLVKKFSDQPNFNTPFALGDAGVIDGVEFTIIGMLAMRETYGSSTWRWIDHQLYSPTHGYAWLTLEDGHLIFSRRLRGGVTPTEYTFRAIENAENRPMAFYRDVPFKYYDSGVVVIDGAVGEFLWTPDVGGEAWVASFANDTEMIAYRRKNRATEIELNRYLDPVEVAAAFGLETPTRPDGVHVLQPFAPNGDVRFRAAVAAIALLVCLVLLGVSTGRQSTVLQPTRVSLQELPIEIPFVVTEADRLVHMRLYSNVDNSWAAFDLSVVNDDDEVLFEASRGVEFYHGYDDGAWTEGSRTTSVTFMVEEPGPHVIEIENPEAEVDWRGGRKATHLSVSVEEGHGADSWLKLTALVFAGFAIFPLIRYFWHQRRRWSGSDWTDDDD